MNTKTGSIRSIHSLVALALIASLGLPIPRAAAIVTSDGHGTHVTTPGVEAFGVNVDGVGQLVDELFGDGFCTGSLIGDHHVLTAAHCLLEDDFVTDILSLQFRFELPAGETKIDVGGVTLHPSWTGNAIEGYDIAVLELAAEAPAAAPRYEPFLGTDEVGKTSVKVGYGSTGFGGTGTDSFDNLKRAGLNLYDATAQDALTLGGVPSLPVADSVLAYDFDNGLAANDVFAVVGLPELGFGDDEVNSAPGDSGGPTFIHEAGSYRVAGVTSLGISLSFALPGAVSRDVDDTINSSWGELSADTRVSSFVPFIEDAVAGVIDAVRRLEIRDGQAHTLNAPINDLIRLHDGPNSSSTTVHVVEGASLGDGVFSSAGALAGLENSKIRVSGGLILGTLKGDDNATITIEGGQIGSEHGGGVSANGRARVSISDGSILGFEAVGALGEAVVHISGGTLTATGLNGVVADDGATVEIDGGEIIVESEFGTGVLALIDAGVTINGGTILAEVGVSADSRAQIDIFGGNIRGRSLDLQVYGPQSIIRLFGEKFSEPRGPLTATSGSVSGILFDGTPFDYSFERIDGGNILLVPEPTNFLLCMAGLLMLAGPALSRHTCRISPLTNVSTGE